MGYDIAVCKKEDRDYPEKFRGLSGMPERFYYCGNISMLNYMTGVAIIGSRHCSEDALRLAREAGGIAAESDVVTINGLALGCDTEALRGALEHGGKCAVVLPGGINRVYPKSNEGLLNEILSNGGCVISEYAPDAEPKKFTFVERDRLQSALSKGVLVIAAEASSGTMHTVKAATQQGRRLAAYSSRLVEMTGNKSMTDRGAREISDKGDLRVFYDEVKQENSYQQMTLFDVI
ncbi:MAG: DNA-protecting protein DprA [Lachnospiraceae bacterium]|nr:DNA-protecting protein DprA [Lachnospiraceae bacterium]